MRGVFIPDLKKPAACCRPSKKRDRMFMTCNFMSHTGVCILQRTGSNRDLWEGQYKTCPMLDGDWVRNPSEKV